MSLIGSFGQDTNVIRIESGTPGVAKEYRISGAAENGALIHFIGDEAHTLVFPLASPALKGVRMQIQRHTSSECKLMCNDGNGTGATASNGFQGYCFRWPNGVAVIQTTNINTLGANYFNHLVLPSSPYTSIDVICDGTNWNLNCYDDDNLSAPGTPGTTVGTTAYGSITGDPKSYMIPNNSNDLFRYITTTAAGSNGGVVNLTMQDSGMTICNPLNPIASNTNATINLPANMPPRGWYTNILKQSTGKLTVNGGFNTLRVSGPQCNTGFTPTEWEGTNLTGTSLEVDDTAGSGALPQSEVIYILSNDSEYEVWLTVGMNVTVTP